MTTLHEGEATDARLSTVSTTSQSYPALVWRRFRKSVPGMLGLILVSLLFLIAIFAPQNPNANGASFAPPDQISFTTKDGFTLWPVVYATTESDELDPITFQPLMGPDLDNPRPLAFFVNGWSYNFLGLIPVDTHFIGLCDGTPLHLPGTDKLGRDILSREIIGRRITLTIAPTSITLITIAGTLPGISSGYIGGRFDLWFQRFVEIVLAFSQLPLYLTLITPIPVTAPSSLFISFVILIIAGLGWAQLSREVRSLQGNRLSMIFQEPMSSLNPVYTIGNQIAEVLRVPNKITKAKAKTLANNPDVVIADEPTTALDVTVQAEILHLIKALKARTGLAVILITHDLTVVRQFADHVYVMQYGEVREEGPTETFFSNPQHPYSKRLLGSEPKGRNIRVTYNLRKRGAFRGTWSKLQAVDGLSLDLKRGETLGLVGESGSGKTTFGQALLRLKTLTEGEVSFLGNRIDTLDRKGMNPYRQRMQIVFQDPFSSLNPRMSVRQLIEEGLIVNRLGRTRADREARVKQALCDAGLPDTILSRFPHEFSGGQRQRLAIALEPEFIPLDEPTSALDLSVRSRIIDLLRTLQREKGPGYLFISHDLKVVRALCHRVIVMQNGRIVEQGPVDQVLENPTTDYTRRLVKAAFEIAA